ncbi:hypothetical protein [Allocoleopsis sp.]|uniref:hypothetical protein n=1 Tax=Allocoleopsis sp. TaxID=3088169 RepID=UPI002FD56CB7
MKASIIGNPKVDELFHWKKGEGIPGRDGCCRIRIYCRNANIRDSEEWVVIGSEVKENEGQSITNCVEYLFEKVCQFYRIKLEKTTWIEHYNQDSYKDRDREEEYSLVTLSDGGRPYWKYLTRSELESLIILTLLTDKN